MGKNVLEIDDKNFEKEVLGSDQPFLLDFGATWCGPCKTILPLVEAVADENVGKVRVGKIDIDDAPEVVRRYGIRGAPTILVFKNGKEVARQMGACGKQKLLSLLEG